ncbi:MAG: ABC transporter ATP-binding protein [Rhodospirillaceae bacterium]|nr:ABC transporter ATP-binding protein [Rhodospirillaceae bacterium]
MSSLVELRDIRKVYGEAVILPGIDMSIEQGQFVVLLGPSGSGKTTLLSILGGFTTPTSGEVIIDGEDVSAVPPARRPTSTVFQDYALFPHMTVEDNIAFGLAMRKVPKGERLKRANEMLNTVGLEGQGKRRIHQLSGGQRQRVALARAIVLEPIVLLLDEPLGALDLKIRRQMQDELVYLQRRIETTFVHVTHDQEEAMNIADVIVVLNKGEIEDIGPPERVYLRPASLFTATFMGDSNVLSGKVLSSEAGRAEVETPIGPLVVDGETEVGTEVHVSVRPEQIRIDTGDEPGMSSFGDAVVKDAVFQGSRRVGFVRAGPQQDIEFLLVLPPKQPLVEGETVSMRARSSDLVLLKN